LQDLSKASDRTIAGLYARALIDLALRLQNGALVLRRVLDRIEPVGFQPEQVPGLQGRQSELRRWPAGESRTRYRLSSPPLSLWFSAIKNP